MALPKKKARSIEVEGVHYHWCANQREFVGDLTITCQHECGQGTVLLINIQYTDPWCRISIEKGKSNNANTTPPNEILAATPSFVRSAILYGLSVGWSPLSR